MTGSVALALHGLPVSCDDLDLVTTAIGAGEVESAFVGDVISPVAFGVRDGIRGHRGTLRVAGVAVEILGDVQNALSKGRWTAPPDIEAHREWMAVGHRRCPVLSLAYMLVAYRAMGRQEKTRLIASEMTARRG